MGQSDRLISVAKSYLGYTESPPNSNMTKFGERYGLNGQPWCVIAIWAWFQEAGLSELFCGGNRAADCGTLRRWYQERGQTVPVENVQPGDILILNFSGTDLAEHCGIVVETLIKNGKKIIRTVEGNTSPGEEGMEGSQDNGGCVALKTRYPYQAVDVIRPLYYEEAAEKAEEETVSLEQFKQLMKEYRAELQDNNASNWSEDARQWAVETGIIQGGGLLNGKPNYMWQDLLTREQFVTTLYRFTKLMRLA